MTSSHLRRITKLESGAAWSSWRQYASRPMDEWPDEALLDYLAFGPNDGDDRGQLIALGYSADDVDHLAQSVEAHRAKRLRVLQ